jgi:5-methylcytosine-specific restriction endonuclease McrA
VPGVEQRYRGTTSQRGYGQEWQRLSRLARQLQPWCSLCASRRDLVCDHKDPATRGRRGLTLVDVQVLCRRCNGSKADKLRSKPIEPPRPRFSRSTLK